MRIISGISLALLYFAAARVGLLFASYNGSVSPFWPAAGVAVGGLMLIGGRHWPFIALAAFVANWSAPMPVAAALGAAAGATLEAWSGAWLYHRIAAIRFIAPFSQIAAWSGVSLVAPFASALCGVLSLHYFTGADSTAVPRMLLTWWLGDGIGIFLVGPLIEAIARDLPPRSAREWGGGALKALFLVGMTIPICLTVFVHPLGSASLFFLFVPILLGTFLFRRTGAFVAAFSLATWTVVAGESLSGPFSLLWAGVLQLQPFILALALTGHLLAAAAQLRMLPVPATALMLGWILGGWIFHHMETRRLQLDELRFTTEIENAQRAIEQHFSALLDTLQGGATLVAASDYMTKAGWKRYVEALRVEDNHPGITALGVVFPVRDAEVESFVARIRADDAPGFQIQPFPTSAKVPEDPAGIDHYVTTFIEPFDKNRSAWGIDLASEPVRKAAARIARDYGEPRMTGKTRLLQDLRARPGFLLFVPVFEFGADTRTVHQRRMHLVAWIYVAFTMDDFLQEVFNRSGSRVNLWIYAGLKPSPEALVYSSLPEIPSSFTRTTVLQLAGEQLKIGWTPHLGVDAAAHPLASAGVLALIPALLAGLALSMRVSAQNARALAFERTRELREVAARLEEQVRERIQAENEAKKARAAAEAANAAKGDFLATMSHEIRTPLNGVLGYADLLAESSLPPEQLSWARNIASSGRTLLTLLNDILDFSKIEAGKLEFETIGFDPLQSIQEVISLMAGSAAARGLALFLDSSDSIPSAVRGDPIRFKQILTNLCSNAIKFTAIGSIHIRVSWRPIRPGLEGPRGMLKVEVIDTGPGIAEDKLQLLFKKFSQLDSSTTRKFGGSGLGLAICKKLVDTMGGRIGALSELGKGTTMWFELPFHVLQALAPQTIVLPRPAPVSSDARRVLLAEDVPVNQKLGSTILKRLGCEVEVAGNGREALEQALNSSFDLIFMDCQMPEMDGFEATRRIRESGKVEADVPIIAATANAFAEDKSRCFEAGMNDYITKPYSPKDFARMLEKWGARRKPVESA